MTTVILCVGNRFVAPDNAALMLLTSARRQTWPTSVRWVEGGLGGLSLLTWFERAHRVLVADYAAHQHPELIVPWADARVTPPTGYDHNTALRYLLHQLPELVNPLPEVFLLACRPHSEDWITSTLKHVRTWLEAA